MIVLFALMANGEKHHGAIAPQAGNALRIRRRRMNPAARAATGCPDQLAAREGEGLKQLQALVIDLHCPMRRVHAQYQGEFDQTKHIGAATHLWRTC